MLKSDLYPILEINTATLCLSVIEKSGEYFHHLYRKVVSYKGFEKIFFKDPEELFTSVQNIFSDCEFNLHLNFKHFYALLPQTFYRANAQEKSLILNGKSVSNKDINKLKSKYFVTDSGFKAVSLIPLSYKLDGEEFFEAPLGKSCKVFSVNMEQVALAENVEELFSTCAKRLNKTVSFIADNVSAALRLYKQERGDKYILIGINERHTDVSLCEKNAVVTNENVEWGGDYVHLALADMLKISEEAAIELTKKLNLNLPLDNVNKYMSDFSGKELFSASQVNKQAMTTIYFIIKEVSKKITLLDKGAKLPLYFYGHYICNVRGLKEILEEITGVEVNIIDDGKFFRENINYKTQSLFDNENLLIDNKKQSFLSDILKIK